MTDLNTDPMLVSLVAGELLNTSQVGKMLGCHPRTVRRFIQAGLLCGVLLGSGRPSYRVRPTDLSAFVERCRTSTMYHREN